MGQPEQFVKQLFEEETSALTSGAATWQGPVELGLSEVRLDGLLRLLAPKHLLALAAPWSLAGEGGEVVLEVKLAGDHLDRMAVERALLRRQAYEVRRLEASGASGAALVALGHVPLWLVAPHLPRWLDAGTAVASGCYELGLAPFRFVWVAANELPLRDELIPFLVARSGAALAEFVRWVAGRRPWALVLRMVQFLPMTPAVRAELERYFPDTDDPEVRERQRFIVQMLLKKDPEAARPLLEEGRELEYERLYERRLGRALSESERATVRERWGRLGAERLGDVLLDSTAEALAAWLADPTAR